MGADSGVLVSDPVLAGSDTLTTVRVLAAALRRVDHDLVLAGADTSDGTPGAVGAGVATMVGLPYLSYAARIEPLGDRVRVRRISPTGYDLLEAPLPALVGRDPGPRRAALPVAQGNHGRPIEDDRDVVAGRPRARSGDARRRRRDDARRFAPRRRRPARRRGSSASRAAQAAEIVVDFLVERRLI